AIPLGYEIKVKGVRLSDGSILARQLEAKPNGVALYEREAHQSFDQLEGAYVTRGSMWRPSTTGNKVVGPIHNSGPDVEGVRSIIARLMPPSRSVDEVRAYVVETKDWNAAAMDNGAIWVYSRLLADMSDDELAIILGHELTHFSHEHGRRKLKQGMFTRLAAVSADVALAQSDRR